jgi:hypothetical protein
MSKIENEFLKTIELKTSQYHILKLLKPKLAWKLFNNSVCSVEETQCLAFTKIKWLMLFK